MQALSEEYPNFQFGIAATIFATNIDDAQNILAWARTKNLDIVFNMLRFTDAMLNNKELEAKIGFQAREEEFMREFFLDRVQEESVLSGQAFMYLHYADMIANGYHRTMPCPFQTQGLLLNPYGDLHYCENSESIGNVLTTPAEELYFKAENLAHREDLKSKVCPTCLSPCQVNVGAMKQFVPYAKFLVRAYQVKHDSGAASRDAPQPALNASPAQPDASPAAVAAWPSPPASPPTSCGAATRATSSRRVGRRRLAPDRRRRRPGARRSRADGLPLGRAALHRRARPSGRRSPRCMRIFFVSTFVGTFLPASVGGDAVRAYSMAR